MSKDADNARRAPRRTFTAEQISTLESSFQHRPYLGPLERWRLAREMRVSEMQVRPRAGRAGLHGAGRGLLSPSLCLVFSR